MADSWQSPQIQDGRVEKFAREDSVAASALVQLQGQTQNNHQSFSTGRSTNENLSMKCIPTMTDFYNHEGQLQSRSDTQAQHHSLLHGNIAYTSPDPPWKILCQVTWARVPLQDTVVDHSPKASAYKALHRNHGRYSSSLVQIVIYTR